MTPYPPPPVAANPIPTDHTPLVWVTFSRYRLPGVRQVLVQKRDGATRHVLATSRRQF